MTKIQKKQKSTRKNICLNLLGILSAIGMALGGLLGVQGLLSREEAHILQSGGMVALPVQADDMESVDIGITEPLTPHLTQEELALAVQNLRSGGVSSPHEPKAGQLSMTEAIMLGKEWIGQFFMPHLGRTDFVLQEYRANCFLWSLQEDPNDSRTNPLLSYWTVLLTGQGMEAELILNAVTGQILDASVSCSLAVEYQDKDSMAGLLRSYADSFSLQDKGLPAESAGKAPESTGWILYQDVGSSGIQAVMSVSSIAIAKQDTDSDPDEYAEIFNLHLYLILRSAE